MSKYNLNILIYYISCYYIIGIPIVNGNNEDLNRPRTLNDDIRKFSRSLIRVATANKPFTDTVLSPISVELVLAMAYLGAGGKTATEIEKGLQLSTSNKNNRTLIAEQFQQFLQPLQQSNSIMTTANKIYIATGYEINPNIQQEITKYFYSTLETINFIDSENAATQINDWISNQTHNLIKNLISSNDLTSDTKMILINTLYFNGTWQNQFNPRMTYDCPFYTTVSNWKNISTMHTTAYFKYTLITGIDAEMIELPYQNSNYSLIIILPNAKDDINAFPLKLRQIDFKTMHDTLEFKRISLSLPKFEIETTTILNEPLKQLGITTMFTEQADFRRLLKNEENIYASKVIQKAFIKVDEAGTVAAAATALEISTLSLQTDEPLTVTVNRPFLYYLKNTDSAIFMLGHFINKKA